MYAFNFYSLRTKHYTYLWFLYTANALSLTKLPTKWVWGRLYMRTSSYKEWQLSSYVTVFQLILRSAGKSYHLWKLDKTYSPHGIYLYIRVHWKWLLLELESAHSVVFSLIHEWTNKKKLGLIWCIFHSPEFYLKFLHKIQRIFIIYNRKISQTRFSIFEFQFFFIIYWYHMRHLMSYGSFNGLTKW
jgi:hypothetical protein